MEAQLHDDDRHPLQDVVERRDVQEVSRRTNDRGRDEARPENIHHRALTGLFGHRRQGRNRWLTDQLHRTIDLLQCPGRLLTREPMHGLWDQEENDGDEHDRRRAAEVENRTPVVRAQQPGGDDAADGTHGGIADRHQRNAEVLVLGVGKFGCDGVDGRQHAADAEPGDDAPRRQHRQAVARRLVDRRDHDHADRHQDETAEHQWPPTDLVGDTAEENRADGHADQLGDQHESQNPAVDAPLLHDAGRRIADGQDIEAVEAVQADGDSDDDDLHPGHRGLQKNVTRIAMHECLPRLAVLGSLLGRA